MTREIDGVKEDLRQVADREGDILCRAALRHIEALEAKLDVLEALIMDVVKQLDEDEEDQ